MDVIIPVAGLGTRLRPQTWSKPKPLVNVAGKPVLGHVLDRLEPLGLEKVVFVTGYLGEQIEDYVRENYKFESIFVAQEKQLGQSHAVIQARESVDGPTMVLFPDMLFEADLAQLNSLDADGALFVQEVDDPSRFGVVVTENDRITRLVEKPKEPVSNRAVVGIYYFKEVEQLLSAIDYQMENDLQQGGEYYLADAIQHMIDTGSNLTTLDVSVWEDCGKPEALLSTNRYLLGREKHDQPDIDGAVIVPPVVIDPTATISNSVIGPYATIGAGATVSHSIVTDSIVDEGARIETAMLTRSIVGPQAFVRGDFVRVNVGDSSDIVLAANSEHTGDDGE